MRTMVLFDRLSNCGGVPVSVGAQGTKYSTRHATIDRSIQRFQNSVPYLGVHISSVHLSLFLPGNCPLP